jgi:hypothetical protein
MSKEIKIKGFVHCIKADAWNDSQNIAGGYEYVFWRWDDMTEQGYILVCPAEITITPPDGFDPTPGTIAVLEAKKRELEANFSAEVARINTEISKLQALTYEPA